MSDTTLNATGSESIAGTRLHDIVVGVDGSDESFAALQVSRSMRCSPGPILGIWDQSRKTKNNGPKSVTISRRGFVIGFLRLRKA